MNIPEGFYSLNRMGGIVQACKGHQASPLPVRAVTVEVETKR